MQNEMISVMAHLVLRQKASSIHSSPFYTVMVDETTDASNQEQVVFCIRWVSSDFEVHEEFMGLYSVESMRADTLISVIKDVLLRFNLPLSKVRGQCYDGASTMSGYKSGVAAKLLQEEPKALYTHCYGHALNLACADAIKHSKVMRDALDTAYEIVKLIKYSPQRQSSFMTLKAELAPGTPGVRSLCPTRWTVRGQALQSILDNYDVLTDLWLDSLSVVEGTEMKAGIHGVVSQMKHFDFFFGVFLSELILRHRHNFKPNVAEGKHICSKRTRGHQPDCSYSQVTEDRRQLENVLGKGYKICNRC